MVVQTAPSVRMSIGEELGLTPGTLETGQMVAAQRALVGGRGICTLLLLLWGGRGQSRRPARWRLDAWRQHRRALVG